mgnify:FL=1
MNKLIKGAVDTVPESVKTVIEVEEVLPLPEKDGVTWIEGLGIVSLVVIVAIAAKKARCCKKK